jgi:hypothetical protein
MRELPPAIRDTAFKATNGEYAWRRADVSTALEGIADSGQATLGGEVWVVLDGRIAGAVPAANDRKPEGVWQWETSPRRASESWSEYCVRTAGESIDAVREMNIERECRSDVRDSLFFNVMYVDETDV